MYIISYQFKGETVEHKQIFTMIDTTVSLIKDLLEDMNKPIVYIRISPKL